VSDHPADADADADDDPDAGPDDDPPTCPTCDVDGEASATGWTCPNCRRVLTTVSTRGESGGGDV